MWQNNRNNNNRHNNSIANDLVVNDSEQRIIITSSMQISSSNDSILPVNQMDDLTSESTGSNVNVTIDPEYKCSSLSVERFAYNFERS